MSTKTAAATVLIADDHPPTRADIRQILEEDGRFAVRWEVGDAAAAVQAAVDGRPQVCLLDVRMPGGGVAAAWEISARLPETKIVMLTVSRDDTDLFAALRAGASGYLLKDIDPARLSDALESVLAGESALPGSLVARLVSEFRDRSPRRRTIVSEADGAQLTSREWQVLELMRQGLTTAQIARRLVVSPATVRSHVASMLKKLRVPDRESALRLFDSLELAIARRRAAEALRRAAAALVGKPLLAGGLRRPRRTPAPARLQRLGQGRGQPLERELAVARLAALVLGDRADDRPEPGEQPAPVRLAERRRSPRRRRRPRRASRSSARAGRPARSSGRCGSRSRRTGSRPSA